MIAQFGKCSNALANSDVTITGYTDSTGTWDPLTGVFSANILATDPGAPYLAEAVDMRWRHGCGGLSLTASFDDTWFEVALYSIDPLTEEATLLLYLADGITGTAEGIPSCTLLALQVNATAIGHAAEIDVTIERF